MSDIQQCQLCGADLVAGGSDINAELAKREAEIERLREAAVIARTTEANLHEEITRLRELLAAIFEADATFQGGAVLGARLEVLVREALGE